MPRRHFQHGDSPLRNVLQTIVTRDGEDFDTQGAETGHLLPRGLRPGLRSQPGQEVHPLDVTGEGGEPADGGRDFRGREDICGCGRANDTGSIGASEGGQDSLESDTEVGEKRQPDTQKPVKLAVEGGGVRLAELLLRHQSTPPGLG